MTKSDLIEMIALKTGLHKADVLSALQLLMFHVKKALQAGDAVYLRGFGTFVIVSRKARKLKNVNDGQEIVIPEQKLPMFRPSKEWLDAIRTEEDK